MTSRAASFLVLALAISTMTFAAPVPDAGAEGAAVSSPGVLSGNTVQVPVHVPVNACGNTVSVIGLLNPNFGNACDNQSGGHDTE
ncbi:hypothetical protein EC957_008674 [Mortierella hygrophila]|uniref:Chaplin domain-containing protein n=1 Tax=Mortierella hygrophila TaxID=979708 RepID=A0A9P6EWZ6_9FUNG|nr:hypothetical protein EC957_008674 [Mortierella hygrophila]